MLGIIGAMDEEVAKIKEHMTETTIKTIAGMEFHKGILEGRNVVTVRSGIGKVNAGICTQILIDHFGVDAVINTGIAGSLRSDIKIGDIVLSTDTVQHDMDASGFGYSYGQIPRLDTLSFPADEKLIDLAEKCCKEVNPQISVFRGRVVSGDQFVSEQTRKDTIANIFEGCCTEMEGAAIGQVAYLNKIPYLVIRAISDNADDTAGIDYDTFEKQAIENSAKLMIAMTAAYEG
ncbi:MAG: 5'-methylthioadenosine/adenosylhomocysteine nucleosidase [[Clostridium] aminophilum]|uniref:5'-methylthioadenosine/adenosylhomocysteine nucleosidase n=1 Tax=[Clostridium] aminophilum TaxID=1526 RepID=UPI0026EC3504|nr:5'-methylthioadenosine/adenosylhomocysteine nucleosidase [[Clostridium] aminophilum]MDD6195927.1 5'-methylthioadenosine/adenosylhomocysteine nucleosidase [[Clostridium] aminophilum]